MPETEPMISVIMGVCYRRSDTALLERSIQSILAQSYGDFEFLICEHGSTPVAQQCLRALAAQDQRIRLLYGRAPGHLAQHLNDCLRQAKGQYIARMDDDDFSHPERFARQLAYLKTHSDLAFVGCDVHLFRDGQFVGERCFPTRPTVRDFYMTQPFIHPSLLFRRNVLEAAGGYSEDKRCVLCEDYDLLLRLYEKGLFGANMPECLLDYTIPAPGRSSRTMHHRWNEAVTRWRRFKALGCLPGALPWVVKPLVVGLVPGVILEKWKNANRR